MAQSWPDWLAAFVESELHGVLTWQENLKRVPHVKPDPDSRFSDDGSNFRSFADRSRLPSDTKLQLLEVIVERDPAVLVVSDGSTRMRAILSPEALNALEAGLVEKLDRDVKGDVFSIGAATLVSTPYGPSDGFVQLHVHKLDYCFHLRKLKRDPTPVEQRASIKPLLDKIAKLRLQQVQQGTTSDAQIASQQDGNVSRPLLYVKLPSSPPVPATPSRKQAFATQLPAKRKPDIPSLSQDGFEVEVGVNLDQPRRISSRAPQETGDLRAPKVAIDVSHLLGLLENGKPAVPASSPAPQTRPSTQEHHQTSLIRENSALNKQVIPPILSEADRTEAGVGLEKSGKSAQASSSAAHAQTVGTAEMQASPAPSPVLRYRRHKIPPDQRSLLNKQSSWLPSLPGQQFPFPNVPIELLKKWNSAVTQSSSRANVDGAPNNTPSQQEQPESSSDSESVEEGLPWSQTPTRNPKDELPPDSTLGSDVRPPSTSPQKLPIRSPAKDASQPQSTLATVVHATPSRTNHDEMELDVPRALPDPAVIHRQRRSEHFRTVQRREWLLANYVAADCAGPYFSAVLNHYQATHPEDKAAKLGLAEAIRDTFPGIAGSPPKKLVSRIGETHQQRRPSDSQSRVERSSGAISTPQTQLSPLPAMEPSTARTPAQISSSPFPGTGLGLRSGLSPRATLSAEQLSPSSLPIYAGKSSPLTQSQSTRAERAANDTPHGHARAAGKQPEIDYDVNFSSWKEPGTGGASSEGHGKAARNAPRVSVLSWKI